MKSSTKTFLLKLLVPILMLVPFNAYPFPGSAVVAKISNACSRKYSHKQITEPEYKPGLFAKYPLPYKTAVTTAFTGIAGAGAYVASDYIKNSMDPQVFSTIGTKLGINAVKLAQSAKENINPLLFAGGAAVAGTGVGLLYSFFKKPAEIDEILVHPQKYREHGKQVFDQVKDVATSSVDLSQIGIKKFNEAQKEHSLFMLCQNISLFGKAKDIVAELNRHPSSSATYEIDNYNLRIYQADTLNELFTFLRDNGNELFGENISSDRVDVWARKVKTFLEDSLKSYKNILYAYSQLERFIKNRFPNSDIKFQFVGRRLERSLLLDKLLNKPDEVKNEATHCRDTNRVEFVELLNAQKNRDTAIPNAEYLAELWNNDLNTENHNPIFRLVPVWSQFKRLANECKANPNLIKFETINLKSHEASILELIDHSLVTKWINAQSMEEFATAVHALADKFDSFKSDEFDQVFAMTRAFVILQQIRQENLFIKDTFPNAKVTFELKCVDVEIPKGDTLEELKDSDDDSRSSFNGVHYYSVLNAGKVEKQPDVFKGEDFEIDSLFPESEESVMIEPIRAESMLTEAFSTEATPVDPVSSEEDEVSGEIVVLGTKASSIVPEAPLAPGDKGKERVKDEDSSAPLAPRAPTPPARKKYSEMTVFEKQQTLTADDLQVKLNDFCAEIYLYNAEALQTKLEELEIMCSEDPSNKEAQAKLKMVKNKLEVSNSKNQNTFKRELKNAVPRPESSIFGSASNAFSSYWSFDTRGEAEDAEKSVGFSEEDIEAINKVKAVKFWKTREWTKADFENYKNKPAGELVRKLADICKELGSDSDSIRELLLSEPAKKLYRHVKNYNKAYRAAHWLNSSNPASPLLVQWKKVHAPLEGKDFTKLYNDLEQSNIEDFIKSISNESWNSLDEHIINPVKQQLDEYFKRVDFIGDDLPKEEWGYLFESEDARRLYPYAVALIDDYSRKLENSGKVQAGLSFAEYSSWAKVMSFWEPYAENYPKPESEEEGSEVK